MHTNILEFATRHEERKGFSVFLVPFAMKQFWLRLKAALCYRTRFVAPVQAISVEGGSTLHFLSCGLLSPDEIFDTPDDINAGLSVFPPYPREMPIAQITWTQSHPH